MVQANKFRNDSSGFYPYLVKAVLYRAINREGKKENKTYDPVGYKCIAIPPTDFLKAEF